jgi:Rad3-related DNA helicase
MEFSFEDRTCALSVGDFASFTLGPRDAGQGGPSGAWRAQLGQQWHIRLRAQVEQEVAARTSVDGKADFAFEVPLALGYLHGGWTFQFTGRIDQLITTADAATVREIKTVGGPLPASEATLRTDYPDYFIQTVTYLALLRSAPQNAGEPMSPIGSLSLRRSTGGRRLASLRAELVFVEVGTGITQTVVLTADDEAVFRTQLERVTEFLNLRLRARDRLRSLRFRPAFAVLRPGQETVQNDLLMAFSGIKRSKPGVAGQTVPPAARDFGTSPVLLFEAPTGYGKTGVLLEFALGCLRTSRFSRLLYLTGKSTGQLQVVRTLAAMTSPGDNSEPSAPNPEPAATPVAAWQVRPKAEHCINPVFHCVRAACSFLADVEARWPQSGLARFYRREDQPRTLEALRAAGGEAHICPYEITRAALPFNDVWIGDYNYVFAPDSRGVFYERPGFNPDETLLIIDEAHNLPARVADAWSHVARAGELEAVLGELNRMHSPAALLLAWDHWTRLLTGIRRAESLDSTTEDDIRGAVDRLAALVVSTPLDYAALGPHVSEQLWQTLALRDRLAGDFSLQANSRPEIGNQEPAVPTLLWCPRNGELHFTCLDAAAIIGRILRAFGGVVLSSATLQPTDVFAASCGLAEPLPESARPGVVKPPAVLGKLSRRARKTLREVTSGAGLLQFEEAREAALPRLLRARAPWREHAYLVGVDLRVDTSLQHRVRHYAVTAAAAEALQGAAHNAIAVFFPSYAYAGNIKQALEATGSSLRVAVQPRLADLAAQTAWVEESLGGADALFLVLGSSFAESIDLLGGRVTHAMVVGPALPEVNAIQRTRLTELERVGLGREAAFRRVYQIPGMQKVNQALGRLVRAPGQQARVLLHCRRFAEPSYATLLSPEYQGGDLIAADADLAFWLQA